jgi:hypothetical protein
MLKNCISFAGKNSIRSLSPLVGKRNIVVEARKMSDLFSDYSFEFSVPGDPDHDLPAAYFGTIPFRTSKFKDAAVKVSKDTVDEWSPRLGINFDPYQVGGLTTRGHASSWGLAEVPLSVCEMFTRVGEVFLIWDGNPMPLFLSVPIPWIASIADKLGPDIDATDVLDYETVCSSLTAVVSMKQKLTTLTFHNA